MPIYAYRCTACGHALDALRKISDPALTVCPACGAATLVKQLTAAGFQLKGSGWYVTDFRGDKKAGKEPDAGAPADKKDGDAAKGDVAKADDAAKSDNGVPKAAPAPAAPAPASAPAPAPAAAAPAPVTPSKGGA